MNVYLSIVTGSAYVLTISVATAVPDADFAPEAVPKLPPRASYDQPGGPMLPPVQRGAGNAAQQPRPASPALEYG